MKIAAILAMLLAAEPALSFSAGKLPPKALDNKGLDVLFAGNAQWKKEMLAKDKDFFKKLGTTHKPDYMYIGKLENVKRYLVLLLPE